MNPALLPVSGVLRRDDFHCAVEVRCQLQGVRDEACLFGAFEKPLRLLRVRSGRYSKVRPDFNSRESGNAVDSVDRPSHLAPE